MSADAAVPPPHIGTLAERSLHAALKEYLAQPGDRIEARVGRYVIDIVRDGLLIEVQTGSLHRIRRKLVRLLQEHAVALYIPIAARKWIVRQAADGARIGRRRSPRQGRLVDVFRQLVYLPQVLGHPDLTLWVLMIEEEEVRRDDGRGSWRRRRWSVADRRLLTVVSQHCLATPADLLALLPAELPQPFTNRDLAHSLGCRPALAQKITYTLRRLESLQVEGKRGRAYLFRRSSSSD